MMFYRAVLSSMVAVMATSCTAAEPADGIHDWNSLAMRLDRGACFGTCPVYAVTIHGDGRVVFEGDRFTAHPGKHETHITVAAVRALFAKFRAANFLALKDEYHGNVTDNPGYRLTLSYDGRTKAVDDYVGEMAGMPASVTELENAIDETANTAQWIKAPAAPP